MGNRRLWRAAAAGGTLVASFGFLLLSYGRWHCPLRRLTGLLCPSCGLTTALWQLLRGEVAAAWGENPLVFFWLLWSLGLALGYVRQGAAALGDRRYWLLLGVALVGMAAVRLGTVWAAP